MSLQNDAIWNESILNRIRIGLELDSNRIRIEYETNSNRIRLTLKTHLNRVRIWFELRSDRVRTHANAYITQHGTARLMCPINAIKTTISMKMKNISCMDQYQPCPSKTSCRSRQKYSKINNLAIWKSNSAMRKLRLHSSPTRYCTNSYNELFTSNL